MSKKRVVSEKDQEAKIDMNTVQENTYTNRLFKTWNKNNAKYNSIHQNSGK